MIGLLGVDILFQDVDIVWYRNPLEYFHDESKWCSLFRGGLFHEIRFELFSPDVSIRALTNARFLEINEWYYRVSNLRVSMMCCLTHEATEIYTGSRIPVCLLPNTVLTHIFKMMERIRFGMLHGVGT